MCPTPHHPELYPAPRGNRGSLSWWGQGTVWAVFLLGMMATTWSPLASWAQTERGWTAHVDVLDEFIERFNNEDRTLAARLPNTAGRTPREVRQFLIRSLIDANSTGYTQLHARAFITHVTDERSPVRLSMRDTGFYAEVQIGVRFQGKPEKVGLLLRYEVQSEAGYSRWVVVGAKGPILDHFTDRVPEGYGPALEATGLNPMSHGNGFIQLSRFMRDPAALRGAMPLDTVSANLRRLMGGLLRGGLAFQQIDEITYHFLQVPGYLFTVRYTPGRRNNSGWLIDQLLPADAELKGLYRARVLNMN